MSAHKHIFLVLAQLIAGVFWGGNAFASNSEELRLAIFSKMDEQTLGAFYQAVSKRNGNVDPDARPSGIDDSDALIFFLDSWSDVMHAPGSDQLSHIFKKVSASPASAVRQVFGATRTNGDKLLYIFYSLSSSGYKPLICYADDVAAVLNGELDAVGSDNCQ